VSWRGCGLICVLRSGAVKMSPAARQLQQLDYNNGKRAFSMRSVLRRYLENNWSNPVSCQLRVRFYTGDCEDRT
jgi:hypothetical protein